MVDALEKAVDRAWHETKVEAAVQAERERCAKICDDMAERFKSNVTIDGMQMMANHGRVDGAGHCAAAIRAR